MYFDGSHYIAIPHTERPQRYRPKPIEEVITVAEAKEEGFDTDKAPEPLISCESDGGEADEQVIAESPNEPLEANTQPLRERQMTRKELFEEFWEYNGKAEMEELYAMFLAAFDQSVSLLRRHTA